MPSSALHRAVRVALLLLSAALPAAAPAAASAEAPAAFLLYPDLHDDFVVFVAGGDLWRVPTAGGEARRLTAHAGQELFPKISPDGAWIAFSAEYSGTRQVWVMPSGGGEPRQLTYYTDVGTLLPRAGFDAWVLGWTPDGKILARFNRTPWGDRMGRYFLVDPAGGLEQPLPMPHGGSASYSPDGKTLVYTPLDREFRTWKRSQGGRAQDLWTYDLAANKSTRLTDFRGTDNFPMWIGDRIFFTSDRSYTLNLFSVDARGGDVRQHTDFADYDVLWPSHGPGGVVFVRGFQLYRFDPTGSTVAPIPVRLDAELAQTLPRFDELQDNVESIAISPSGKRLLLEARGDVFSVPAEKGAPRNLTLSPAARERDPAWSADGRRYAYLSDATGEYELYLRETDAEADTPARQLTKGSQSWYFAPRFSPDGRFIALPDRQRRLHLIDAESGESRLVASGLREDLTNFAWSPDSRFLAYERTRESSRLVGLEVYEVAKKRSIQVGDGLTNDFSAAFSQDSRHLFFLSNRDYNLTFSAFEFNYVYTDATRVFVASLGEDEPALFPLQSDEEKPEAKDAADQEATKKGPEDGKKSGKVAKADATFQDQGGKKDTEEKKPVVLTAAGWVARTVALPGVAAGNLTTLQAQGDAVYYLRFGDGGRATLQRYDLGARKEENVLAGVQDYQVAAGGKKLLLRVGEAWHVVPAGANVAVATGKVDLGALRLKIEPRQEWRQIYDDAWRISRDFFYDPAMHGMDWAAIGQRYRALLPGLTQRQDLDLLISELIAELGAGHTYVRPGEVPAKLSRVGGGLLGAEFAADAKAGAYQIARIFPGENWDEAYRSPLTEPGIDVDPGDYLLAIDGQPLTLNDNPYRLLEGKANQQVLLTVNRKNSKQGARKVLVRTVGSELNLRYLDWLHSRMAMVDKLSGGRIGYIHLPNTAIEGNRMMQKLFYSQSNREALIVDDRYNQGGFIPDRLIEYLLRTPLAWWSMRDLDPLKTPGFAHDGPKAMLMNGYSASGGDALPYFFRLRGLGPLIGSRTWGGLIGLNGNPNFLDGGGVDICTFRIFDAEGRWVVENEGVVPDYEVFDTPEGLMNGGDPSIEKAVEVLLAQLAEKPRKTPPAPAPPDLHEPGQ